ncbi:MAG: substrate-binding domain-containing protein [Phycisphaerae bacterium]|nr:substrate-binding domain-containing protein [Phycisphaerae bacterium]
MPIVTSGLSRREALRVLGAAAASAALPACAPSVSHATPDDIVLYSSVDGEIIRPLLDAWHARPGNGERVRLLGDTEATKTTGLMRRVLDERPAPRADVWWSNELLATVRLAREGALQSFTCAGAERDAEWAGGGWPGAFRARDATWYAFACRARAIVSSSSRLRETERPRVLGDLAAPRLRGRVGLARPAFGTTRAQMALLLSVHGEGPFTRWLESLARNGTRLYDGNSAVVRAVSRGELDAALTDTDDALAGIRNGWKVALGVPRHELPGSPARAGELLIPNSVGLVRGGPNPAGGRAFLAFVLSGEVERRLAADASAHRPIRPSLAGSFAGFAAPDPVAVDPSALADAADRAVRLCERVLGG